MIPFQFINNSSDTALVGELEQSNKRYSDDEAKWYENLEFPEEMQDELSIEEVLEDYTEDDAEDLKSAIEIADIKNPVSVSSDSVDGTGVSIDKLLEVSYLFKEIGRHEVRITPYAEKKFVYTDEYGLDCIWVDANFDE